MKYLKCKYCNRTISVPNLPRHIEVCATSSTTYIPYRLDHDDLFCKFCGRESKTRNSLIQHEIRCNNNPDRLVINYIRIGFNNPGRAAWNKGLTKDTNESIRKAAITYASNRKAGKHKQPVVNSMNSTEVKARHKAKMKEIYAEYHKVHTKGFKQGYYKHIWCDSS